MSKSNIEIESGIEKFLLLAVCCIVIPIAIGLALIWFGWATSESWPEAAQHGDFWGGHLGPWIALAGSLLFFLALIVQLAQLKTQQQELRLQREELGYMRDEMTEARKVYEAQRNMMERHAKAAEQQTDIVRQDSEIDHKYTFLNHAISISEYSVKLSEHRNELYNNIHTLSRHTSIDVDAILKNIDDQMTKLNAYIVNLEHNEAMRLFDKNETKYIHYLLSPYKS